MVTECKGDQHKMETEMSVIHPTFVYHVGPKMESMLLSIIVSERMLQTLMIIKFFSCYHNIKKLKQLKFNCISNVLLGKYVN